MVILNKAKRYRFDQDTFDCLSKVGSYGVKETKFVRQAIKEKLERDLPELIKKEEEKIKSIECPF